MLRNIFTITIRNFARHKAFTSINLFGLALGMASSLIILLWVQDELNKNRFHENIDRIYQLAAHFHFPNGQINSWISVPYPIIKVLQTEYPDIAHASMSSFEITKLINTVEQTSEAIEMEGIYADTSFFKIFSFPFIQGSPHSALKDLNSILISEELATKLYGNEWSQQNLLGKTLIMEDTLNLQIQGVYQQISAASTIQFDFVLSFKRNLLENPWNKSWGNHNNPAYLTLKPEANAEEVGAQIQKLIMDHNPNVKEDKVEEGNPFIDLSIQAFGDRYLYGKFEQAKPVEGRIIYVRIFIINEVAAKAMEMGDPINKPLSVWDESEGRIIGLVQDFHISSLYNPIEPTVLFFSSEDSHDILIRTQPNLAEKAIEGLQTVHQTFKPSYPFTYTFLDEEHERTYKSESVTGQLANMFALIAICISCLGLYGLAAFMAERRTREIGIRKVLGASVKSIMLLLGTDFFWLVIIAIGLAMPFSFFLMSQWLESFAYRVGVEIWILFLSGILAILVACLTVSLQTFKAASKDPVRSLRME